MKEIELIDNNPEQILQDMISEYKRLSKEALPEASAERIMIDVLGYREGLLRSLMQKVMKQNFVQYAQGVFLNNWGVLFGVSRNENETDESYRKRILGRSSTVAVGTKKAYYDKITALADVADVLIETKQSDTTLPPSVIRLYPLMQKTEDNKKFGAVHNSALEGSINNAVNDTSFGLVGEQFVYSEVMPVAINGSITLNLFSGTNKQTAIDEVGKVVDEYINGLSLKLKGSFDVNELERRVRNVNGVREQSVLDFVNIPNLTNKQFLKKGTINIV